MESGADTEGASGAPARPKGKFSTSRLIYGVGTLISLLFFVGAWLGTIITSGFSLTNSHTYAGWLHFPLFWPHLAAAVLAAMLFMRYGANWVTAFIGVLLWLWALPSDLYGTILYWRLGWLCNISGLGSLTPVESEICGSENPLLISLWVASTLLLLVGIVSAVAQVFDIAKAGRAGKSAPKIQFSPPVIIMIPFGTLSALIFASFWVMNVLNSGEALIGRQAFAVWAHANVFSIQIPATILSLMLGVRYGANWATAVATPILWAIAFFSAFYGAGLYWELGWFCHVAPGSPMTGVDLEICDHEEDWLTAVWVLVSALGLITMINFVAHLNDIGSVSSQGQSVNPLRGFAAPQVRKFLRRVRKGDSGDFDEDDEDEGTLGGDGDLEGAESFPLMKLEGGEPGGGDAGRRFFTSASSMGRFVAGGGVNPQHLNQFVGAIAPGRHQVTKRVRAPAKKAAAAPSPAGRYLAARRAESLPAAPAPAGTAKPLPSPPASAVVTPISRPRAEGLRRKRAGDDGNPTLG